MMVVSNEAFVKMGILRALHAQGFEDERQTGSHLTLWNEEQKIAVTVPIHTGCGLGRGLAIRILKDADFSVDDYLRLR